MIILKKQPQEEEKNAVQSSFTETPNTKNAMKLSLLKLQTKTSIYKKFQRIHDSKFKTENPIKFDRSVESSSTPITKPIPETIYAIRPKKPNLELSNSSKMFIALFGER